MKKRCGIIFGIGLMVSLVIMYGTELGIPGITQFYKQFKLLDMQFTYNYDIVTQTFLHIGAEGMRHYQSYLLVDLGFIIFLWLVQAYLNSKIQQKQINRIAYALITMRMLFDLTENTMIMIMLRHEKVVSSTYVTISSTITSLKFICLYSWIALTCLWWIRTVILRKTSKC